MFGLDLPLEVALAVRRNRLLLEGRCGRRHLREKPLVTRPDGCPRRIPPQVLRITDSFILVIFFL